MAKILVADDQPYIRSLLSKELAKEDYQVVNLGAVELILEYVKDFRDYRDLYNPYRNEKNELNPHKSYGYLLQPKLAKTMFRFFGKISWEK